MLDVSSWLHRLCLVLLTLFGNGKIPLSGFIFDAAAQHGAVLQWICSLRENSDNNVVVTTFYIEYCLNRLPG